MKIRIQPKGLKAPYVIEDLHSVVVLDDFGNPMYVGQQIDRTTCIQEKAGHPDFERLLNALGIGLVKPIKVIKTNG